MGKGELPDEEEPDPQTLPPSELTIQPSKKLVFNAPFDEKPVVYLIKVIAKGKKIIYR